MKNQQGSRYILSYLSIVKNLYNGLIWTIVKDKYYN